MKACGDSGGSEPHLMPLTQLPQVVSAASAPLKTLNDLLHTKAGRKAPNRLRDAAALVGGLGETLALLGLDASKPQSILQVPLGTLFECCNARCSQDV